MSKSDKDRSLGQKYLTKHPRGTHQLAISKSILKQFNWNENTPLSIYRCPEHDSILITRFSLSPSKNNLLEQNDKIINMLSKIEKKVA